MSRIDGVRSAYRPLDEYCGPETDADSEELNAARGLIRSRVVARLNRSGLTDRQQLCWMWRLKALSVPQIAKGLALSESTVRNYLEAAQAVMKSHEARLALETCVIEEFGYEGLAEMAELSNWRWFAQRESALRDRIGAVLKT